MFHKYFNPVKKLFVFRFAISVKESVIAYNSLVHSVVPTDTPIAGCRWEMPFHFFSLSKIITEATKNYHRHDKFFHTYEKTIWAVPNSSI